MTAETNAAALAEILASAQRSGLAHNNGAGGQYLLCATESQLLKFAALLRAGAAKVPDNGCGRCDDNTKPCDISGSSCAADDLEEQLKDAIQSRDFYKRRCDLLQKWQSKMRDPERVIVCDILANGDTLPPEHAGDRYTATPPDPDAGVVEPAK